MVRQGAKFCPICGKGIAPIETLAPEIPPAQPYSPAQPGPAAPSSVKPGAPPAAAPAKPAQPLQPPPAGAPGAAKDAPKSQFRKLLPWIIGIVVLLCLLMIGMGLFLWQDPFGYFGEATPTASLPGALPTLANSPTVTPAQVAQPTSTPPAPTLPPPTLTAVPTNTQVALPTPSTPTTPTGQIILEDNFEKGAELSANWRLWGDPEPLIESTLGLSYLRLDASAPFGAGVTSKTVFLLTPGLQIQFEAELPRQSAIEPALALDWDAAGDTRQPNTSPGVLRILVQKSEAILMISSTNNQCAGDLNGEQAHTFVVRILEGALVAFEVDGGLVCQLPFANSNSGEGRLSLSGQGLVDQILVTVP
jgi:hypothetical protein